eukprot:gene6131-7638_t
MSSSYNDPPLQGYIIKLGKYVKSWNRRWLCVENKSLKYYVSEDKLVLKGTILFSDIEDIKVEKDHPTSPPQPPTTLSNHYNNNPSSHHSQNCLLTSSSNNSSNNSNKRSSLHSSLNGLSLNNTGGNTTTTTTTTSSLSNSNHSSLNYGNLKSSYDSNHNVHSNNNINNNNNNHHHHQQSNNLSWIFSIKVKERIYMFKTSDEFKMHYWIQGIKNIQLQLALEENVIKENQRQFKRLSIDANEMLKREFYKVQTESKELRKQDQFKKYQNKANFIQEQSNKKIKNLADENHHLQTVIENNNINNPLKLNSGSNSSAHKYVAPNGMALWFPDDSSFDCYNCKVTFNIFRRRHHCRNCGLLFCSKCSRQTGYAKGYIGKLIERVAHIVINAKDNDVFNYSTGTPKEIIEIIENWRKRLKDNDGSKNLWWLFEQYHKYSKVEEHQDMVHINEDLKNNLDIFFQQNQTQETLEKHGVVKRIVPLQQNEIPTVENIKKQIK